MRKDLTKFLAILSIILGALFAGCEDDFTEEDVLDAQQTIDVSIFVLDPSDNSGLSEVSVTILDKGAERTILTNEAGVAYFTKVNIGDNVLVKTEKEGYIEMMSTIDILTDNFRQKQFSAYLPLYSLTENTATVKGRLEIETDLTNDETEYVPEGTKVSAFLYANGIAPIEFATTTDSEGRYEFTLPADNYGLSYELRYESLELSQKIAINKFNGEPDFPATVPSIVNINTVFSPTGNAANVPSVRPVYAVVDNTVEHEIEAVINYVSVNSSGQIYDFYFSNNGSGYTEGTEVDINIVSLLGGSGAQFTATVSSYGYLSYINTIDRGTGYPTYSNANQTGQDYPYFTTNVKYLRSGEIRIMNGDYGTGIFRDQEIQ